MKKESEEIFKRSKISSFFQRLISYGAFSLNKGIIIYWGDYSVFIPTEALVSLFHQLELDFGKKETKSFFYWLGRIVGSNSVFLLSKKFGVDKSKLNEFINGATQDGFGYLYIKELSDDFNHAYIIGRNSRFALKYKEMYGKIDEAIDFYVAGMLAGGAEPLLLKNVKLEEIKCMAKGDEYCLYEMRAIEKKEDLPIIKKLNFFEDQLLKKIMQITSNRKLSFFYLKGERGIYFGDGSFKLRNIEGFNFMSYSMVVLSELLKRVFGQERKKYLKLLAEVSVESIKPRLLKKDLSQILKEIEIFGYGRFIPTIKGKNNIILINNFNPYACDYFKIFGKSEECVDIFIEEVIRKVYELNGIKVNVKEIKCMAKGDKNCLFKIDIIS